jgi:hypothetical protein
MKLVARMRSDANTNNCSGWPGRRHGIARVAADRVEDRLQQDLGGAGGGERCLDDAAIRARAAGRKLGRQRADSDRNAAGRRAEQEQICGIGIDRQMGCVAFEDVALGTGRNADGCEGLAAFERCARLG